MTDLILNYIAVNVICAIALMIMAYSSYYNVLFIKKMKEHFILAALIAMMVILAEVGSVVFENIRLGYRVSALIFNVIGFSLSPLIAIVMSNAFSVDKGKIKSLLTIPVWINFVLVITSPWSGLVFNVNADIIYSRGPLFGVYILAYLASYAILIINSIESMKYYQCQTKNTFIILIGFSIIGTSVQIIFPQVHISWLCVTLSIILFYAYFCVLTETQDALTGLLNRNVYDRYSKNLYHDDRGILIVFDLDHFKQTNDLYGHHWGDSSLRIIGGLIKDCFYKMGFSYRIGGDEFCVICKTTDEKQAEDALSVFHRKIDNIRKNENLHGELPTVSTGYAVFQGSEDYEIAVNKADAQMYFYKNNRKQNETTLV